MTMPPWRLLIGSEFDEFLSASIGEDRNGTGLSVLSTLARLDVDQGSESSRMGRFRVWLDQGSPSQLAYMRDRRRAWTGIRSQKV
jgi:hypothetical protein